MLASVHLLLQTVMDVTFVKLQHSQNVATCLHMIVHQTMNVVVCLHIIITGLLSVAACHSVIISSILNVVACFWNEWQTDVECWWFVCDPPTDNWCCTFAGPLQHVPCNSSLPGSHQSEGTRHAWVRTTHWSHLTRSNLVGGPYFMFFSCSVSSTCHIHRPHPSLSSSTLLPIPTNLLTQTFQHTV